MRDLRGLSRRRALLGAGAAAFGARGARAAQPAPASAESITFTADDGRPVQALVWRAGRPVGAVVFSHGGGASPSAYQRLLGAWAQAGWTVLAPIHADSALLPAEKRTNLMAALPLRMAEIRGAAAEAKRMAPGRPLMAAGHSYGSVFAASLGGGLADRGGKLDPEVRGVIMMSSPGVQPGLITPQAYAGLATPLLVLTGDADVVPGMVPDWRAHLRPFETSPAGAKTAIVRKGGEHGFGLQTPGSTAGDAAVRDTLLFLQAYGLRDAAASKRWAALAGSDIAEVRRR